MKVTVWQIQKKKQGFLITDTDGKSRRYYPYSQIHCIDTLIKDDGDPQTHVFEVIIKLNTPSEPNLITVACKKKSDVDFCFDGFMKWFDNY